MEHLWGEYNPDYATKILPAEAKPKLGAIETLVIPPAPSQSSTQPPAPPQPPLEEMDIPTQPLLEDAVIMNPQVLQMNPPVLQQERERHQSASSVSITKAPTLTPEGTPLSESRMAPNQRVPSQYQTEIQPSR